MLKLPFLLSPGPCSEDDWWLICLQPQGGSPHLPGFQG